MQRNAKRHVENTRTALQHNVGHGGCCVAARHERAA